MATLTQAHSVVAPTRLARSVSGTLVIVYALVTMVPLVWIVLTSFKTPPDSIAYPPKLVFTPSIEGYCNLFTTRTRQTAGLHRRAAAAGDRVRPGRALAQHGDRRPVQRRPALHQFDHHRLRLDLPRRLPRHAHRLRLLALQGAARRRSPLLHPVDALHAADRGGDPDLPDVPGARPHRHASSA